VKKISNGHYLKIMPRSDMLTDEIPKKYIYINYKDKLRNGNPCWVLFSCRDALCTCALTPLTIKTNAIFNRNSSEKSEGHKAWQK